MPTVERSSAQNLTSHVTRLCVGPALPDDPMGRTRAFVFTLATALTLAVCLFYFVFFLAVGRSFDGWVVFGLVPLTLLNTLQCRRPDGLVRALIGLGVATNFLILYLVYREGGVGPTSWWLIVPPYMFVNCGMHREAIVALAANVAAESVLLLVNRFGTPLSSDMGTAPDLLFLSSRIGLAIVMLSSMIVLDRSRATTLASLRQANSKLERANESALAAAEAKARFLATMSHEIRTPMNGVMGAAELLKRTSLDAKQGHYLDTLQHSGIHLLELINDVLDFSKLEAGKAQLEQRPFNPRDLVEDVLESLAPRAHAKALVLHARVAPEVPETIVGDAARLRQILTNLGANAVKFTSVGDVGITVGTVGHASAGHCRLRLAVRDTGIGLDVEQSTRLFQAFTQADGSTTRIYGGTGLGLAISNELARLMGGSIVIDSTPGEGASFSCELEFPVAAQDAPAPPLEGQVLVVDPFAATRESLAELLLAMGVQVQAAAQMPAALPAETTLLLSSRALITASNTAAFRAALEFHRVVLVLPCDAEFSTYAQTTPHLFEPIRRACLRATLQALWHPTSTALPAATQDTLAGPVARHVLLVEDNPVNLEVAAAMLEQAGCEVDIARDGREAIERWMRGHHELVLMDCQMPVLDGLAATRGIRAAEAASGRDRCRIVALTANAFPDDRARCLEAGMDDFLSKPFTFAQLEQIVRQPSATTA